MSGSLVQLGVVDEVTYGTAVAVTKFFEILSEDVRGEFPKITSEALGSAFVVRSDRFAVNPKGATGNVSMEVLTKGFGFWLKHMLGDVQTSGPAEVNAYTHTGTMANLKGDFFTMQIGKPDNDGVKHPFTYSGCKVTEFEFSNSVDGILQCSIGVDAQKETTTGGGAFALAVQSLPVGAELFTYAGGTISIGGAPRDVYECSVSVSNNLRTDAYVIRKGSGKKEPYENGKREVQWSVTVPFVGLSDYNKIAAATAAGAMTELTLRWEGPTLLGSTIYPSLEIIIPVARFDEGVPSVEGEEALELELTGIGMYNGTDSPVTIEYVSADVTP